MKIAFIGGTRFIGHASASWAVERGHDVSVVHRGQHPNEVAGARSVLADRSDPSALTEGLRRLRPDVVVDTRALTRPEAQVTALVLKVLEVPGVVLSSQDVYAQFGILLGHAVPEPEAVISEASPLTVPYPHRGVGQLEGGDEYDKKDVESEFLDSASKEAPGATILRLPATYGPRDFRRRWGAVVDALDADAMTLPHQGGAQFRWTQAHVRDVAHAVVLAAEHADRKTRIYNVGAAVTPTAHERVEELAATMGATFAWQEQSSLPPGFDELGSYPHDLVVDDTRIRQELGFVELTVAEERSAGLVAWLRSSRMRG